MKLLSQLLDFLSLIEASSVNCPTIFSKIVICKVSRRLSVLSLTVSAWDPSVPSEEAPQELQAEEEDMESHPRAPISVPADDLDLERSLGSSVDTTYFCKTPCNHDFSILTSATLNGKLPPLPLSMRARICKSYHSGKISRPAMFSLFASINAVHDRKLGDLLLLAQERAKAKTMLWLIKTSPLEASRQLHFNIDSHLAGKFGGNAALSIGNRNRAL